jgi:hypothetical protein
VPHTLSTDRFTSKRPLLTLAPMPAKRTSIGGTKMGFEFDGDGAGVAGGAGAWNGEFEALKSYQPSSPQHTTAWLASIPHAKLFAMAMFVNM